MKEMESYLDGYKEKVSINNKEEDQFKYEPNMIDNSFFKFVGDDFI